MAVAVIVVACGVVVVVDGYGGGDGNVGSLVVVL